MAAEIRFEPNPRFLEEFAPLWEARALRTIEDAATLAKHLCNKDTGKMASGISGRLRRRPGEDLAEAVLENPASYAIWQELEPGDIAGSIRRARPGGKAHLRPGLLGAMARNGLL